MKKKRSVRKILKANECQCCQENLPGLICSYSWVSTSNFWIHVISPVKETKLEISVSNFASLVACRFQALFGKNWIQKLTDELQWYKINTFKGFIYAQMMPICFWSQFKAFFSNLKKIFDWSLFKNKIWYKGNATEYIKYSQIQGVWGTKRRRDKSNKPIQKHCNKEINIIHSFCLSWKN